MKTTLKKDSELAHQWFIVDAAGVPAGRLAARLAMILRGKNKPEYTLHQDHGDFVVVINAAQVKLSGRKEEQKIYQDYSGYPSGQKRRSAAVIRARNPERIIAQAVKGMLPDTRLCRQLIKRLKVYPGAEHPHAAQNPVALKLAV